MSKQTEPSTPTADALEEFRSLVFGRNPGPGAVRKAAKEADVKRNPLQRAISPQTIEQIRKVEKHLRAEVNDG